MLARTGLKLQPSGDGGESSIVPPPPDGFADGAIFRPDLLCSIGSSPPAPPPLSLRVRFTSHLFDPFVFMVGHKQDCITSHQT